MKKAFDANVSRARPRVRLTASSNEGEQMVGESYADAMSIEAIAAAIAAEPASLAGAVRERAQARFEPKPTVAQAMHAALQASQPLPAPTPVVSYSAPPVPSSPPVPIHRP